MNIQKIASLFHRRLPASVRAVCDVEDLAQVARVKAWVALPKYDSSKSTKKTFLSRVVNNGLQDEVKRLGKSWREARFEDSFYDFMAKAQSDAKIVESMEALERFLDDLTPELRSAILDLCRGRYRRSRAYLLGHREEILKAAKASRVGVEDLMLLVSLNAAI